MSRLTEGAEAPRLFVALPVVLTLLGLGGCGVSYKSPTVESAAAGATVDVVSLTMTSVVQANATPYTPRGLPAAFFATGGGGAAAASVSLPDPPDPASAPAAPLELRIPPAHQPEPYRIGVGDVLSLTTESESAGVGGVLGANRRQSFVVRDDGAIAVPEIGSIQVAGRTVEQAESDLFPVFVQNQLDPSFALEIEAFNSKRVSVGGAVGAPRIVPIALTPLKLGEVLAEAGGMTVDADDQAAIRLYRDGTLYQIPVSQFFARGDLQQIQLKDGDAIYVDQSYDLDQAQRYYAQQLDAFAERREARQAALLALQTEINLRRGELADRRALHEARGDLGAEPRDYVYLTGEVAQQGRYVLPYQRQVSLADVLLGQGGFPTVTGDPSAIYVLRAAGETRILAWHLDASNAANMIVATRMEMRPSDVIFVEEQPITKWSRALQQAFPILVNRASNAIDG
ncbi:polysaccharide biosynthesis/export family protein [Poseidonocella sedimentorum]|uniref:Polysaccharide export outer membrane protein n=1 Tax=Poseidonocella sedimentorum TaxID=871652 RepID=A0A1I6D5P4_9RHOB|nr:polysaccharide biosynthesis/export family protein [Poseidonocella sedimentorum]SFR00789.1 polysaccharide export outer membrane protein [Poseidonocella sedimentorum]